MALPFSSIFVTCLFILHFVCVLQLHIWFCSFLVIVCHFHYILEERGMHTKWSKIIFSLCQVLLDRKTSIKIQQTVFFARSKNEDFAIILCICRFILLTPCMKNHVSDVMNSVSKSADRLCQNS